MLTSRVCLITSGLLCLAGGIVTTCRFTQARASEYSLLGGTIELDGEHEGEVTVELLTSVARTYVALQGTWSINETTAEGADPYFALSGMSRGDGTTITYGANGIGVWTPEDGIGMPVAANGTVMSATYIVDKDTPAGTYMISFSEGLFTYGVDGSDVDENDIISYNAEIVVTRSTQDDPADPTDPTEPTDPTDPMEPTDPTGPTEPTEPTGPTEPTEPTGPTEPTEPTGPSEPIPQELPDAASETTPTTPNTGLFTNSDGSVNTENCALVFLTIASFVISVAGLYYKYVGRKKSHVDGEIIYIERKV